MEVLCALFYVVVRKGLEQLWILVSVEVPGTNPLWKPRDNCNFWGVKSWTWIFNCTGVGAPNPLIVQGSRVNVKK